MQNQFNLVNVLVIRGFGNFMYFLTGPRRLRGISSKPFAFTRDQTHMRSTIVSHMFFENWRSPEKYQYKQV